MRKDRKWLRASRSVPFTRWAASNPWSLTIQRFVILMTGLTLMGIANALLLHAHLGTNSWTVLADGMSKHLSLTVGTATFLISVLVFLIWIPIRQRPGIGTILNIIWTAVALDLGFYFIPDVNNRALWQILYIATAILCGGAGGAIYATCRLGLGPRDGLAIGMSERLGTGIGTTRLAIELSVLFLGILLGGTFGIGTIIVSLSIGGSIAVWLHTIGILGD